MGDLPNCLKCDSKYTYEDGLIYVCPECGHEWAKSTVIESVDDESVGLNSY